MDRTDGVLTCVMAQTNGESKIGCWPKLMEISSIRDRQDFVVGLVQPGFRWDPFIKGFLSPEWWLVKCSLTQCNAGTICKIYFMFTQRKDKKSLDVSRTHKTSHFLQSVLQLFLQFLGYVYYPKGSMVHLFSIQFQTF